jgi:hypothetical protein
LIQKNWKNGKVLPMVFIDHKKASHNVKRNETWKSLEKIGTAADLLRKEINIYIRGL